MTATKKNKKRLYALLSLLVVMLSGLLIASPTIKASAATSGLDFHGIDVTGYNEITEYYMYVPIGKLGTVDYGHSLNGGDYFAPRKEWTSSVNTSMLITLSFNNIKLLDKTDNKEKSVYFQTETKVKLWSKWSLNTKAEIVADYLEISLTNNYYKSFLAKGDSIDFSFNLYIGNLTKQLKVCDTYKNQNYKFKLDGTSLKSRQVPIETIDPDNDDFDPNFGNNGTNTDPDTKQPDDGDTTTGGEKSGSEKFNLFEWIAGFLGTDVNAVKGFSIVICIVGVILLAIKIFT